MLQAGQHKQAVTQHYLALHSMPWSRSHDKTSVRPHSAACQQTASLHHIHSQATSPAGESVVACHHSFLFSVLQSKQCIVTLTDSFKIV